MSPPAAGSARSPANVRVESIRVDGFRALRGCCMALEPGTTVLLGENNTGKTTMLEALAVAFGRRRAVDDDLRVPRKGPPRDDFTIDVSIVPVDGQRFEQPVGTLLGNGIRRDASGREYAVVRTTGSRSADRGLLHLERRFLEGWSSCADDVTKAVEIAGAPPVNDRVLGLIAFTLLDASRDLEAGLHQRLSHWGRLVSKLDIAPGLKSTIEQTLEQLANQLIGGSQVLADVRDELCEARRALATVTDVQLAPLPSRVDELARSIDVLVTAADSRPLPLRLQGLGSRSLAELLVFRAFAATLIGVDEPFVPQAVTALEEPEAHLHPQGQIAVARLINSLPGQRLVSTHSAHLASVSDISAVRFFRRDATGISVRSVTNLGEEDCVKVRRLVERPYGEVLFARLVVIGDGATERAGLPVFARAHWDGTECEGKGVSVVDPGSLSQAAPLVKVLEDLGIPWLLFVDGDPAGATALTTIGDRIGRLLDATSPEVVALTAGEDWEGHLLGGGHTAAMEKGINEFYGAPAFTAFCAETKNIGLAQEVLVGKFLRRKKGTHGAPIAEAIVAVTDAKGRPTIPTKIAELLARVDQRLATP